MKLNIDIVDAFSQTSFKGNSAAVIITERPLSVPLMQSIAAENNLSETAFLVKNSEQSYDIRWFSPLTEVAFCGHATLASASVLFGRFPHWEQVIFDAAQVGKLTVAKLESGLMQMDFPNTLPEKIKDIPPELTSALSIPVVDVYRNQQAYFVLCSSAEQVLSVTRNNELLCRLAPYDVVVTGPSHLAEYDFISRYFWPANGGDEDPVTGSIHTGLAPLWATMLGKQELVAYQASQRGGVLYCCVEGDRVLISGYATPYLSGEITLPN